MGVGTLDASPSNARTGNSALFDNAVSLAFIREAFSVENSALMLIGCGM